MTRWGAVEDGAIAVVTLAGLLVTAYAMALRYLLPGMAPDWGEEITTYAMVWAVLLGGGALVTRDRHVRADVLVQRVSFRTREHLRMMQAAAGLLFCLLMTWYGTHVVAFASGLDERGQSTLRVPLTWYYASLPFGMGLMAIRYGKQLADILRRPGR